MATDVRLHGDEEWHAIGTIDPPLERPGPSPTHGAVPGKRRRVGVVAFVLLLLCAGAGLRAVRLDEPGLEQYPTRQYNSALLARKYEQAIGGNAAGLSRHVVRSAAPAEIEPPIMEAVTAVAWRISGSEPLWFPRVLSILAWTLGGWLLFLLLDRLASAVAGVAAVAVWSLLPFGIAASRTFQPDPLMVAGIVGAVLALVVYDDEPTRRHLVIAGLVSGFAIFVKLPAAFLVAPVFVVVTYRRRGPRELWSRRSALYAALSLGPALAYNGYGLLIGGFLGGQEGGRVLPQLLLTVNFWHEWGRMIGATVFFLLPLLALAGLLLARGRARAIGFALVGGYVLFGLVFSYHYETHSYYHLPLLLVLSVGVGLLAHALSSLVRRRGADLASVGVAGATIILALAGSQIGAFSVVPPSVPATKVRAEVTVPAKIGMLVHHATGVVFLAPSYGDTLKFYGGVAGTWWPTAQDIALARLEGRGPKSVPAQFQQISQTTGTRFFVATDLRGLHAQPDLRAYLSHYPLLASDRDYLVYDLRRRTS